MLTIFGLIFYFTPTYVAYQRQHSNIMPIFLTNLFFGFTGIGWVAALIWSMTDNVTGPQQFTTGMSPFGRDIINFGSKVFSKKKEIENPIVFRNLR